MRNLKFKEYTAVLLTLCLSLALFPVFGADDDGFYKTLYSRDYLQMWKDGVRDYKAEDDGWTTYCKGITSAGTNSVFVQDSARNGQLAGGQDNNTTALYNTDLSGANIVKGQNFGMNMRLQIWFNAKFNGTTPVSGFYFRHSFTSDTVMYTTELIYRDESGKTYTLYSSEPVKGKEKTYQLDYELRFDSETAQLKLINNTISDEEIDTGVLNLKELLAAKGVEEYNKSGKFAFMGEVQYGFVAIRNIEIKSWQIEPKFTEFTSGMAQAGAPRGSLAVLNGDDKSSIGVDLSGQVDGIAQAELYVDGEDAEAFDISDCNLRADLPKLPKGIHYASARIKTVSGITFDVNIDNFCTDDYTIISGGAVCGGNTITSLADAYGKSVTAGFRYSRDTPVTTVICLYDEAGNMCGISYGTGANGASEATISVPQSANGYKLKAFACENFKNSRPISGVLELR